MTASRELEGAVKRIMRSWTRLEQRREILIDQLRALDQELATLSPIINSLFGERAA